LRRSGIDPKASYSAAFGLTQDGSDSRRATPRISASRCFEPIEASDARVLILGSLPGQTSLLRAQYYAQPQNAFWRIMGDLFGAGPQHSYDTRLELLKQRRVAVWDVCASACRLGSLDSAIDRKSLVVNDFAGFFETHPRIAAVACNGATAAVLYSRSVQTILRGPAAALPVFRLPSTSPAHAAMSYAEKLAAWTVLRELLAEPATA